MRPRNTEYNSKFIFYYEMTNWHSIV